MPEIKTRKLDIILNNKLIKKDFKVPEFWSDTAANIAATKYATEKENSALEIIYRVAKQITDWGEKEGYFLKDIEEEYDTEASEFEEDLKQLMIDQKIVFNSPIYFNLGVKNQGRQASACFVGSVEDNMEDILRHTKRAGMIFKSGSGIGINVSKLRAEGESLSNKGTASGPISFMKMWDRCASVVKSGGKTRRAAVLIAMDIDHPDIKEFIHCKSNEEDKAKILIDAGISAEEAYATVDFQNANHSVVITDEFMQIVRHEGDWNLTNRGDGRVSKTLKARDLFNQIAEQAWKTGDPGLQFRDTINKQNPLKVTGTIENSNPCGEVYLPKWGCCQLCAFNLPKYLNNNNELDIDILEKDAEVVTTAMDIIIGCADYPTEEFKKEAVETRPLGIGATDLAGYLIRRGLAYNSEKGRIEANKVIRNITEAVLTASIKLAKKVGPFPRFEEEKESTLHHYQNIVNSWSNFMPAIELHGIRNCTATALAPNGSSGLLVDSDGLGIEPIFALQTTKTLVGGGTLELIPKCVKEKLESLYEEGKLGSYWNDNIEELISNLPEKEQKVFLTANEISWKDHIRMVASLQQVISQGISKTINLPNYATVEDIKEAYMMAWELGCKGITVYRDGSKELQPLRDSSKKESNKSVDNKIVVEVSKPVRKKLPADRKADCHKIDIAGFEGYLHTGLYEDGSLGEIFIRASKQGSFQLGMLDSFATMVSVGLQYGVPLEDLVNKFKGQNFEPQGITQNPDIRFCKSVVDYIFKYLEQKFLVKEFKVEELGLNKSYDGPLCSNCGGFMTPAGSCFYCNSCGSSSGGCS